MKNLNQLIILLMSLCVSLVSCTTNTAVNKTDETNIRKAYEALAKKDFTTFAGLCADDYQELGLAPEPIKGVKAATEQYAMFVDAFPDIKFNITDIAPAGKNRYFLRVHVTGTNTGKFGMLPPTGKSIDFWDMDIIELNEQGKCISHWSANPDAALSQIGLGSLNNPNTAVTMAAYEAFGKKDVATILNLCTEDVMFEVHDDLLNPNAVKIYKGKQEVAKFFEELSTKVTYSRFQPVRFLADGDDIAIIVSADFKNNADNKNYTINYSHHFHLDKGKINSFKGISENPRLI